MIDIGVATSVAKKYKYSWEYTVQFCEKHLLTAIQFYFSLDLEMPELSLSSSIGKRYLHLPDDVYNNPEAYFSACEQFRSFYKSDKIILHQNNMFSNEEQIKVVQQFNNHGFVVGIENENARGVSHYLELLKLNISSGNKIFCVLDIHKFFHIFHKVFHLEIIKDTINNILFFCKTSDTNILLHVIDSKSFQGDRFHWRPMFKGIIPYAEIFNLISKTAMKIEALIFEYEDESMVEESLKSIKSNVIFFTKN